ncbi:MAG: PQQ-dependent sugar dehydrogenase [Minisyncoccia bacterium]
MSSARMWLLAIILLGVLGGAGWYVFQKEDVVVEIPVVQEIVAEVKGLQPITPTSRTLALGDEEVASFRLAEGFDINVAAEEVGKARFMALAPDGRLFVPDMVNYNLSHQGKLNVLGGFDPATGTFATKHTYLSGLRTPNSVAFYRDENGKDWLYLALTAHLVRYPYKAGDTKPSGPQEIVAEFPNSQSPGEVSVVWHITRTIFFHEGRVYVSVGSGCNACEQLTGDMRAMIYSMKPDGSDKKVYGDGLRNTVGITIAEGELYATANGVDHLGEDAPEEMMYHVEEGKNYGWPYCYAMDGKMVSDTSRTWDNPKDCASVPSPLTTFEPRSAPLGLRFFDSSAHPALAGSFLVALHGSFEAHMRSGNKIMRVTPEGEQSVFMDGFQKADSDERWARPVDFLQYDANSFFFSDDEGGRIYFVRATGA